MSNMKRFYLTACFLVAAIMAFAQNQEPVFVIPVETEIDNSAFHHFRHGLEEARGHRASLVIVRLNTFGGALDAADSIRTAILRLDIPTVAFVDVNAASAGALIALACDSVFMAPGASMGSATVVNGAGEPMPEKYQSYMSTIMRATAEHHGRHMVGDSMVWRRNPDIAASMVNPEMSVSLTGAQAVEIGYADGIAGSLDALLKELGRSGAPVSYYQSTLSEDILGFLSNAGVRAVLVMFILGGIFMEMKTAGLGFAAAVAVVASILFFLPMVVTGTVPAWVIICLIGGVILIAMEVFVIPGFGVCGVTGIVAVVASLVGAWMANDSVSGFDISAMGRALAYIGLGALLAVGVIVYLCSSRGPKSFRKHSELMTELKSSSGFVGVDMGPASLVGTEGKSVTVLRPAGKIEIDGNIYDAVSTGEFIPAGRSVRVKKYENAQLYVVEI